jgi:hypothetical protein
MRRSALILVAVVVVFCVGLVILVGVINTRNQPSKTEALSSLCSSLTSFESSIKTLTSLPSDSSMSEYESSFAAVQNAWDQVKSDARAVQNAPTGQLDSAWNDLTAAVKNVPNSASVSDAVNSITQAVQQLVSAAQSTASQIDCSGSASG